MNQSATPARARVVPVLVVMILGLAQARATAAVDSFGTLATEFGREVQPLMKRFCLDCHSTEEEQGDLDLERFARFDDVRRNERVWRKVVEMLDEGEMPPKKAEAQPSAEERAKLRGWVARYLKAEAYAIAGDPGPVVLRRLNNVQYTHTLHDLTGFDYQPAREFPADSAAGEGFTNTGNALVMSPSLLGKYLESAKRIASHAVLLPDGLRFAAGSTRRDWTDELLAEIRGLYARHADADGHIALEEYFAAAVEDREAMTKGAETPASVAARRGLNARYFTMLWAVLNGGNRSLVLDEIRSRWRAARPADAPAIAAEVRQWQQALARFQTVGHMKPWVVAINPASTRQEARFKFPDAPTGREFVVYLEAESAGADASVVWERLRLVKPGRPELPLRDLRALSDDLFARRGRVIASTANCLKATAEADENADRDELARKHHVDPEILGLWLEYLGLTPRTTIQLNHFTTRMEKVGGYDFVNGWGSSETPLAIANSSDDQVRVPGVMKPHGVAVHPSPTLRAAVGWLSPITGGVQITGVVQRAHPECGNGVTWQLELRRGDVRRRLGAGNALGTEAVKVGSSDLVDVRPGDLISLLIGPRDGNHACDLTAVDLTITAREQPTGDRVWDLAREVSGDVKAGNPHADAFGNAGVWHLYQEPEQGDDGGQGIPAGSLLARWTASRDPAEKQALVDRIQELLAGGSPDPKDQSPDAVLQRRLTSLGGPLVSAGLKSGNLDRPASPASTWGLDPAAFGTRPGGASIAADSLAVKAPSVVEVRLPAELVAGAELVGSGVLGSDAGAEGLAQLRITAARPTPGSGLRPDAPLLISNGSDATLRAVRAFDDFRRWFPPAICYAKIVPVDEVVTLTLFHREDEPLSRLMLDPVESARLDRLWEELRFISREALIQVDAFNQLMEYATQDSDPRLFEPYRKPITAHAAEFRKALVDAEPAQLEGLVRFASLAYRRPLSDEEAKGLRGLYAKLRTEEIPHEEAIRLTLARVLVSPSFLYRLEKAAPGPKSAPVTDWELASRLSYFLRSSVPDAALREVAAAGRLRDPDVLAAQARRLLQAPEARRLATEFACQWLDVYGFDALDEKSERHFPTFNVLRGAMYEETIRFFTDLFQSDASVLSIFDADHAFLNEDLAKHYGIPGVTGPEWRRVDGVRKFGRGGILGLSATLSKHSGASRTSPILRGTWVTESLLGEGTPKPPPDVPILPDEDASAGGLSVRQIVEKHTSDARCMGCHSRIDPFGFSLEAYDAIGRFRDHDASGQPIDAHARLRDGVEFDGYDGLRRYLSVTRRDTVVRQFSKKLLGYALGREVLLSDEPLLDEMRRKLEANGYRVSTAVEAIVRSRQFREIRGDASAVAENR